MIGPVQASYGHLLQLDRARADKDASAGDKVEIDKAYLSEDAQLASRDYAKLRAGAELLSKADAAHEAARTPRDGHVPGVKRFDAYA